MTARTNQAAFALNSYSRKCGQWHVVRALCGVFFVNYQDHESMPTCPDCLDRGNSLFESDF